MSPESHAAAMRRAAATGDWHLAEAATRAHAGAMVRRALRRGAGLAWAWMVALGPCLPPLAMLAGLAFPWLADLAFPLIPAILVLLLMGGLLGLPALSPAGALGAAPLAITLCLGLLAPPIGWVLAAGLGAGAEARAWVALAAAAPVGAATLAASLAVGAPGMVAAGAMLASVLASPLVLPCTAWALGAGAAVEPGPLALRLVLLVALPAALALALRRVPCLARPAARRRWAEVALVALSCLALARMQGVAGMVADRPRAAAAMLPLALLPSLAGMLAVLPLLRGPAGREALLAGGARNVALVWVVLSPALPAEGHLFMALTALPVFAMPALVGMAGAGRRGARP